MPRDEGIEDVLALLEESKRQVQATPARVRAMQAEAAAIPEGEREALLLAQRVAITRVINEPWMRALELMSERDSAEITRDGRIPALLQSISEIGSGTEELVWQTFPGPIGTGSPRPPAIPDAFSDGRGDISSSLAIQGVLASLRDGQAGAFAWRKGDAGLPVFDYVQSQGTARVLLRPDTDTPTGQALADALWNQVTKFTDIDADVLLAMMAQAIGPGPSDAEGATWITAAAILDHRGVQPIKKREGRVIRRAGHRVEDMQEIAACVGRLSSQWVELLAVETRETQGRRKPPKVTRTTYESRLISVDEQITQGELGGAAHSVAWRYRLGRCITEFLHGPNRQVAPVMRRVLQYDPYRERFEKRLALYFTIHHRIAATYKAPLRRKVGRLFEELRLPVDRRNPTRSRQRLEDAMDRLVTDSILAAWQYTQESQRRLEKLPARGWVDDWLACSVETPPARASLPIEA